MWDLIVSVPDHCLSFYFGTMSISANCSKLLLGVLSFSLVSLNRLNGFSMSSPSSRINENVNFIFWDREQIGENQI